MAQPLVVTGSNAGYIPRIKPYLESLSANNQPAVLVCVGDFVFDPHLPGIGSVCLTPAENYGAPPDTECAQHGAWLKAVNGKPENVVIFTDGDITLQRPFDERERAWMDAIPDNVIGLGYNSGPDETLAVEAARLQPRFTIDQIAGRFRGLERPCYNIGVMVARRSTYQRIYDAYLPHWETVTEAFGHMARQQWLMCWIIAELGIRVDVTPYSFHANGHYGVPPGCVYADGALYHGNKLVALRHKL